MQADSSCLA